MKRTAAYLILAALLMTLLTACSYKQHEWVEANCTDPETCSQCGETRGEALGHSWTKATCTAPKTCRECGKTKGDPNGHTPGPMAERIDEVKNLRYTEQQCTECDQVLVSEFSAYYDSYSNGEFFVFSAESFMKRMSYLASENGMDLSYEFADEYGSLVANVKLNEPISWNRTIRFYNNDYIRLPYADSSVPGLWCIQIGTIGPLDELGNLFPTEVFELFCITCDPHMNATVFQSLDLLRMGSYKNFVESGERSGYGDHNGLQYEFYFSPAGYLGYEFILVYASIQ